MNLIKPENLKPGSTIAFVSVAGEIHENNTLENAKIYFEKKGYKVKIFAPENNCAYLGGTDNERLSALHSAFLDPDTDALIAMRGGYGSLRLLNNIDWQLIKNNPKIFAGYSDITALLLMIYKKSGLITFHAPMVCSDFGDGITKFTENNFFKTLCSGFDSAELTGSYNGNSAYGTLWGGNLSTVVSLCGQDFLPEEKFIMFCEDINEPVYKIDRVFTQLGNIQKFRQNIAALVIGDFSGLDDRKLFTEYIKSLALSLNVPVFSGLKSGHEKDKLTLPVGVRMKIENLVLMSDEY